ncbi:MAG: hypothetical protein HY260_20445 [Chloroflexi bacterium]|nr:hypothetical protein [Chloroflexota bacterium]
MKKKLPTFKSVEEEIAFWETHSLADYWDELEDVKIDVRLRHEQPSPRIVTLKKLMTRCPIDQSKLLKTLMDYSGWSQGRLLLVRRVPVLECDEHGHRFFTPATARRVEAVFENDRKGKLKPDETMSVPVVILKQAA